ncbi:MAG: Tim44/TimA family putative adaptor protein [Thalassobaculales bacterium]
MQFLDIIFFAMVAVFLFLRLRSVLGKRTGNERRPDSFGTAERNAADTTAEGTASGNVVALPGRERIPAPGGQGGGPAAAGLAEIAIADPSFDPAGFLGGARAAFAMIVEAYAQGRADELRPLLADDVYARFAAAIEARERKGEKLETTLVAIRSAEIVDARLDGRVARVTVSFVTEQVNVTRDSQGAVVEGDPSEVETLTDIWTFARDTGSGDPNWLLVETRVPE